jgi:hypothetical protein
MRQPRQVVLVVLATMCRPSSAVRHCSRLAAVAVVVRLAVLAVHLLVVLVAVLILLARMLVRTRAAVAVAQVTQVR